MEKMKLSGHILLLSLVVLTSCVWVTAAEPVVQPTGIDAGWKIRIGDDLSWADPDLADSDWQPIDVGEPWDEQGMAEYDGFAWYRLHLLVPEALKDSQGFQHYQSLKLNLGLIDDVDQTWFNGELVGETGSFPEPFGGAWETPRSYTVPAHLIRWDKDNVIAVRVYDHDGAGGMYEGPYELVVPTWRDYLKVEIDLGRGDGVFVGESGLPIVANLNNGTQFDVNGKVDWRVEDDEGNVLAERSAHITADAGDTVSLACDFAPTEPGFYKVTCTVTSEANSMTKSTTMFLGYRPEEVHAPLTRQDDFDAFWRETLEALRSVDPQFKMVHKPEKDTDTHEVYEVEMRSLGNVRVRGWYEKPKGSGRFPAILRLPGYTQAMTPSRTSDPVAVLSFNIRAHGNSQDDVSGEPSDYWVRGLDDKYDYFYRGAYSDCVRAVDFLATRPEVDVGRIASTGGSQGGGLSLAVAALDDRISCCAPDIPFMLDFVKYFKASHWPEIDNWIEAEPHRSWETMLRTLGYFDILNFADRIKCPVFLGVGLQDGVCPPATIFSVYNRLDVPKQYRVYPHAGHWVDAVHNVERREWLLKHLG